jgi:hypothetical protein
MKGIVINYPPADKPIEDDNPEQGASARLAAAATNFQPLHKSGFGRSMSRAA